MIIWLVVWNMTCIFPSIWNHHPTWLSYLVEGLKPPARFRSCTWFFTHTAPQGGQGEIPSFPFPLSLCFIRILSLICRIAMSYRLWRKQPFIHRQPCSWGLYPNFWGCKNITKDAGCRYTMLYLVGIDYDCTRTYSYPGYISIHWWICNRQVFECIDLYVDSIYAASMYPLMI